MELTLKREDLTAERTIGKLTIDGVFQCYVLEDVVRPLGAPKVYGKTAIPAGRYRVVITSSKRFEKLLPLLLEVLGFEGIRIHAGNTAIDTDGCLLVGNARGKDSVAFSRAALGELQPKIQKAINAGDQVWITISTPTTEHTGQTAAKGNLS